MKKKVISIPTINDHPSDFAKLFEIWRDSSNISDNNIIFEFSQCRFLRPNAVAFLGGLSKLIAHQQGNVEYNWNSFCDGAVLANLCQNGFAGTFGYPSPGWDGNSIPYQENTDMDMNSIMDYLTEKWIGKGWINVSEKLRDAIAGTMWEVYANAFEHSETKVGVYSCGQRFKRSRELIISTVDFGKGIPTIVKEFFLQRVDSETVSKISSAACLKWAIQQGNSTTTGNVPRGLGLDLLQDFVKVNHGKLEIYSNDGYAIIDKFGARYENLRTTFNGTVVHVTFQCDENLYQFRDETR